MRRDMPKVIVERPRRGAAKLRNRKPVRDDDELLPSKIGVKRDARERGGYKTLNENLNPLKRYLAKQVGRPWNKVWSEVCENLKATNTVQQHVRDHIPDFVAINATFKDGEIWVQHRWAVEPLKGSFEKLFVDPKSGLLRQNKHWRSWSVRSREKRAVAAAALAKRMRVVSPKTQLHLLDDGGWWEVTLARAPTQMPERPATPAKRPYMNEAAEVDVVQDARLSALGRGELYASARVYAVAKRQLSRREIRDLKLR